MSCDDKVLNIVHLQGQRPLHRKSDKKVLISDPISLTQWVMQNSAGADVGEGTELDLMSWCLPCLSWYRETWAALQVRLYQSQLLCQLPSQSWHLLIWVGFRSLDPIYCYFKRLEKPVRAIYTKIIKNSHFLPLCQTFVLNLDFNCGRFY